MAMRTGRGQTVMLAYGNGSWVDIGTPHSTKVHTMSSSWAAMQDELGEDQKLRWDISDQGACFSHDGTAIAAFGEPYWPVFLRVWDTLTAALRFVSGTSRAACFSPDGTVLAAGRQDEIQLLDARMNAAFYRLLHLGSAVGFGVHLSVHCVCFE